MEYIKIGIGIAILIFIIYNTFKYVKYMNDKNRPFGLIVLNVFLILGGVALAYYVINKILLTI